MLNAGRKWITRVLVDRIAALILAGSAVVIVIAIVMLIGFCSY
jgi:hypothetical protein